MPGQTLITVFADAAWPQKLVFALLVVAILVTPVAAILARSRRSVWRHRLVELGVGGPALGLTTAAMNGFHMAQTIQKLPIDVTAKQLAPGIFEITTLAGLGGLVGLAAILALLVAGGGQTDAEA